MASQYREGRGASVQVIPLYRVILSVGFCADSLSLKPLCGWAPDTKRFRFAVSSPRGTTTTAATRAFDKWHANK